MRRTSYCNVIFIYFKYMLGYCGFIAVFFKNYFSFCSLKTAIKYININIFLSSCAFYGVLFYILNNDWVGRDAAAGGGAALCVDTSSLTKERPTYRRKEQNENFEAKSDFHNPCCRVDDLL